MGVRLQEIKKELYDRKETEAFWEGVEKTREHVLYETGRWDSGSKIQKGKGGKDEVTDRKEASKMDHTSKCHRETCYFVS